MNKLTIKACPLCGGTHLERTLTCVDHYATGEMFHLCRCRDCGFLFTQDFPAEAEIGRYYETPDYISHTDTRKGAMNSVYHWVRRYMLGRKGRLVEKEAHRKEGRLLDIGTGTGYFADTMLRRGWQVEAVEKSGQARLRQGALRSGGEATDGTEGVCAGQLRRHHPVARDGASGTP